MIIGIESEYSEIFLSDNFICVFILFTISLLMVHEAFHHSVIKQAETGEVISQIANLCRSVMIGVCVHHSIFKIISFFPRGFFFLNLLLSSNWQVTLLLFHQRELYQLHSLFYSASVKILQFCSTRMNCSYLLSLKMFISAIVQSPRFFVSIQSNHM